MAKNTGRGSRIAAERGLPDQFREAKERGGDFDWASRRRRRRSDAIRRLRYADPHDWVVVVIFLCFLAILGWAVIGTLL